MVREMGGRFEREGTGVYLWLTLVDVWQKITKFCKAIILQLKKIKWQKYCFNIKIMYINIKICVVAMKWTEIRSFHVEKNDIHFFFLITETFDFHLKWKSLSMSDPLRPHGLYSPWNSPGHNTGVGSSLSLLQGIFPTQGSSPGLLHCRWILYQLSHKGGLSSA